MSNDLLQSLAGEGAVAARGEFQLDQAKARQKMEQFQLVDPYLYILELVQGAHLLGATRIDFTIDADELWMTFDGEPLTEDDLEDVYSAAFSRQPDARVQARRHFAIALTAVGALNAADVQLRMFHGDGRAVLLRIVGDDESVAEVDVEPDATTHQFYLKEKFRFGHIVDFFKHLATNNARELELIRDRCRYASFPITVNDLSVDKGHHLSDETNHQVEIDWDGEQGLLGIVPGIEGLEGRGIVHIVQNGVLITEMHLTGPVAVEAMVETDRLTKNLSQSAFVEDEHFRKLMGTVIPEARYEAMVEWAKNLRVTSSNYVRLREICLAVWDEIATKNPRQHHPIRTLGTALERVMVWPIATPLNNPRDIYQFGALQMVPLRAFVSGPPDAVVGYSRQRYPDLRRDTPVFLLRSEVRGALDILSRYTRKKWVDLDDKLENKRLARQNEERWERREWEPPNPAVHPKTLDFEVEGYRVECYKRQRNDDLTLVHVHQGRVLNSGRVPEQLPAVQVVIHGDFQVNESWTAPLRTGSLERVYRRIVQRLPEHWQAVAASDEEHDDQVAAQLSMAALQFATGTYYAFALRGFGFGDEATNEALEQMNDPNSPEIVKIGSSSYPSGGARSSRIAVRLDALGPLADAPIVHCRDGYRSLRQLYIEGADDATIWTADLSQITGHRIDALREWNRGAIVDETYPFGYMVDEVFESTTDAIVHLDRFFAEKAFLNRDVFQTKLYFDPSRFVLLGTCEGPGWTAKWGARESQMAGANGAIYHLYKDRVFREDTNDYRFAWIDIAFEGEAVEPNDSYDDLRNGGWLATARDAVKAAFETSFEELVRTIHDPDASVEADKIQLVWSTMARAFDRRDVLAEMPFACDTEGHRYNARQLKQLASGQKLAWVRESSPVLDDLVQPGRPIIEVANRAVLRHLEQIVGGPESLLDCTDSTSRRMELSQARDDFFRRPERQMNVPFAMMTAKANVNGVEAVAGLRQVENAGDNPSLVIACKHLREVERFEPPYVLGSFDIVVNHDDLELDPTWTRMTSGWEVVLAAAEKAAGDVVVRYLSQAGHGQSVPRGVRRRIVLWQKKAEDNKQWILEHWPPVWELLERIPIFLMPGQGWVSIADIAARVNLGETVRWLPASFPDVKIDGPAPLRVSEEAADMLADRFGDSFVCAASATIVPPAAPERPDPGLANAEIVSAAVEPVERGEPKVYVIDDLANEMPQKPAPKPEEILIEALKDQMRSISIRTRGRLPANLADSVVLWGNDPRRVARISPESVSVMSDHIATNYVREDLDDTIRQAFLASAVITAINHFYEEIGDDDEVLIQQELIEGWSRQIMDDYE